MRNPTFRSVRPDYKKSVFETVIRDRGKTTTYLLPFGVFRPMKIDSTNRVTELRIDEETGGAGAWFALEDGSSTDFPADLVLYHCDPEYDWSPLNQLKRALKEEFKRSKVSMRVLADALETSPSQVLRLLQENSSPKQLQQLERMAAIVGCRIELSLKKAAKQKPHHR